MKPIPQWRKDLLEQYGHTFSDSERNVLQNGPNSMAQAYHLASLHKKYAHMVEPADKK